MITKKHTLILGGLLLTAGIAYGFKKKVDQTMLAAESFDIIPMGLPKNLRISNMKLMFNIDIKIINKSPIHVDVSGFNLAKLKALHIYYKGIKLASANVELDQLNLNSGTGVEIKNLPIEISLAEILQTAPQLIPAYQNNQSINFDYGATIDVLGQQYEI